MNRVIYLPAHFVPVGKYKTRHEPTGKTEPGMFGFERDVTVPVEEFVKTGESDCNIDGGRLANDVAKAVAQLNAEGYEVVSVTPLTTGDYHCGTVSQFGSGVEGAYGYGYSYTKGLILIAKRITA